MSQLGIGAMIDYLGGRKGLTEEQLNSLNGRKIKKVTINPDLKEDGALVVNFDDGQVLTIWDGARSCCESRYMHTDDDLVSFEGAELREITIDSAEIKESKYGDITECDFLRLHTDRGVIVINTYNEHNGYYGGISFNATLI